jgi:hypothetical protein
MPRGAGRVGPSSDRRAASRPRPGRGACGRRANTVDAWALTVGGRGSEKREARVRMGRPEETRSGLSPEKQ